MLSDDKEKSGICEEIGKFGEKTSIHGVGFWTNSGRHPFGRLFHFLVWLFFFGSTGVVIYKNTIRFLLFEARISITEEYPMEMDFPSVTICPSHSLRKSRVGSNLQFLQNAFPGDSRISECYDPSVPDYGISTDEFWGGNGNRIRNGLDFLWIPFERIFRKCSFLGREIECGELFFGHVTSLGRCFTFNYNGDYESSERSMVWIYSNNTSQKKAKKVKNVGLGNSLRLLLDFQLAEYCRGTDELGFYVNLHDPSTLPPLMVGSTLISPGFTTQIIVSENRIDSRAVENIGLCTNYLPLPLYPSMDYSQENCVLQCIAEVVFCECGCVLRFSPLNLDEMVKYLSALYPDVKPKPERLSFFVPCYAYRDCEHNVTRRFHSGEDQTCLNKCPEACTYSVFESHSSIAPFLSSHNFEYYRNLSGYESMEVMKENLAEVTIYLQTLQRSRIVKSRDFGFYDLMSSIGGTIGLFLGASLFSIVEIINLLWRIALCCFNQYSKKTITQISPPQPANTMWIHHYP